MIFVAFYLCHMLVMSPCCTFHFIMSEHTDLQFRFSLFPHTSVDLAIWSSLVWEQCNLFASKAFFSFFLSFHLSDIFSVFLNIVQAGLVWFTLNTVRGHEETLKSQNSLPLSNLLHVYLYTMSNHAIVCLCVCMCVRVDENMCVYIH